MENQAINQPTAQTVQRQSNGTEIDLVELFYVMWGHAWQIILCLILGAGIAFGVTKFLITPMYQATSSIYIVSASNKSVVDLTDLQIGAQLTADYQELLVSRPLLEDVIQNLDLKDADGEKAMSVDTLRDMIAVTNTSDTRILKITVTSPDPDESADIANELVDQACIYLPQIMETDEPNLVEEAIPPTSKSSPSYSKNIVLGGLLGVILCCGVLTLRYLMNDTFMTPDDVERYLGVQPLATIPEGNLGDFNRKEKKSRKGSKMKELEIKKLPQLPFDMTEALNQLRINLGFCGDQIKTIMVTSSVPNEGKSFITMQLWKMMAEVGTPVLMIDCDFRNSEMRRKYSIGSANGEKLVGAAHYLAGQADIQDVIYKTNIPNGYMIPVTSAIANPTILLESPNFARMLEYCEHRFAYVLVDTPPLGSVADALNVTKHCDGSVLVIRSGSTPRKVVQDSVQMLKRAESPLLGVVLNRADVSGHSSAYYHRYYHSNYYYKNGYRYGSYGYGSGHGHSRNKKEDNGGK